MNSYPPILRYCLWLIPALIMATTGCAPSKYVSPTGKELVLGEVRPDQVGTIDSGAAQQCLAGEPRIYGKLFGESHNPCAELGIYLINNSLADEGIPLLEKGLQTDPSYNASLSAIDTRNLGVIQKTRVANLLYDICLKEKVIDLHDNSDITADVCAKAGELYEQVRYRENAIRMYQRKCELTGRCEELTRLKAPVKR